MAHLSTDQIRRDRNRDEMKRVEQDALREIGFSDVRQLEGGPVVGHRNNISVMIKHLNADADTWWEIVMAAGDSGTSDLTRATREEVANKLRSIQFFD
jgi:hypothetical protein